MADSATDAPDPSATPSAAPPARPSAPPDACPLLELAGANAARSGARRGEPVRRLRTCPRPCRHAAAARLPGPAHVHCRSSPGRSRSRRRATRRTLDADPPPRAHASRRDRGAPTSGSAETRAETAQPVPSTAPPTRDRADAAPTAPDAAPMRRPVQRLQRGKVRPVPVSPVTRSTGARQAGREAAQSRRSWPGDPRDRAGRRVRLHDAPGRPGAAEWGPGAGDVAAGSTAPGPTPRPNRRRPPPTAAPTPTLTPEPTPRRPRLPSGPRPRPRRHVRAHGHTDPNRVPAARPRRPEPCSDRPDCYLYRIRSGDTLTAIAGRRDHPRRSAGELEIEDPSLIHVGDHPDPLPTN